MDNIKHSSSEILSFETSELKIGFSTIIKNLCEDNKIFSQSAYDSLFQLLTYDGRLAIEHGIEALNDIECEIFKAIKPLEQLKMIREYIAVQCDDNYIEIIVFYNSFGRLHIRPVNQPIPNYGQKVKFYKIGYILIPKYIYELAERNIQIKLTQEFFLRSKIDAFLKTQEDSGDLQEVIEIVNDAVRHVEDVYIYIDDEIFSVVADRQINLIETHQSQGLFNKLKEKSIKEWTPSQRLALAGLWFLFLSGRSIRFEEFNGKLMTACRLSDRLHKFLEDYTKYGVKVENNIDLNADSGLFELAKLIGEFSQQSVGQRWLRYRMVNGLNFWKTEKLTLTPQVSEANKVIPESIASLYESWVGKLFNPIIGYDKIFTELAEVAISASSFSNEISADSPAKLPIEILIQEIVTAAVLVTNADYGMSSSLRNPTVLIKTDYQLCLAAMLELKPKDFYCCIVSRPGLSQKIGPIISEQVYRPVQARMEYNRWHFLPGNFPRKDVPFNRYYFYPPLVPDLAEWSDQQHPGHILASVRYSIRAPGPDMNQPPLLIAKRPYRGFYDVRVVRMEGEPFKLEDMIVVRSHNLWMGIVWNRIIAHCEKNPNSIKIVGFEKSHGYEPLQKGEN